MKGVVSSVAFLVLLAAAVSWYLSDKKSRQLSFVPSAMDVRTILYAKEEAWGFGPGGNETGIIVYELPVTTSEKILSDGIDWLEDLAGSGSDWRGWYRDWYSTPFDPNVGKAFDIWEMEERAETCGHGSGIAGYMFRYGWCVPFDPHYENLANEALSSSGNFYAFGRIGMLLLVPGQDLAIYAYNG